MRLGCIALGLLLALALPAGAHHDGQDPTITDGSGDAGAAGKWGDLTEGWIEEEPGALAVRLDVADLAAAGPPLYAWVVVLDAGGQSFFTGAFYDVGPGAIGYLHGTWDRATNGPLDLQNGEGNFTPGAPGNIMLALPLSYIAEQLKAPLPPATTLTNVVALSGQVVGTGDLGLGIGGPVGVPLQMQSFDDAKGKDVLVAQGAVLDEGWRYVNATQPASNATLEPTSTPSRTPDLELPLAALAVAATALLAMRRRA